ncbi:hypothetical protein DMP23_20885 [Amycolatopsis sp. A1MSW2902]|uniref:hypothetical protein n=1 Tax=Amycolatopsis sp. A1MSW2902 TaxID=687413 RepID=UPI00307EA17E
MSVNRAIVPVALPVAAGIAATASGWHLLVSVSALAAAVLLARSLRSLRHADRDRKGRHSR